LIACKEDIISLLRISPESKVNGVYISSKLGFREIVVEEEALVFLALEFIVQKLDCDQN